MVTYLGLYTLVENIYHMSTGDYVYFFMALEPSGTAAAYYVGIFVGYVLASERRSATLSSDPSEAEMRTPRVALSPNPPPSARVVDLLGIANICNLPVVEELSMM